VVQRRATVETGALSTRGWLYRMEIEMHDTKTPQSKSVRLFCAWFMGWNGQPWSANRCRVSRFQVARCCHTHATRGIILPRAGILGPSIPEGVGLAGKLLTTLGGTTAYDIFHSCRATRQYGATLSPRTLPHLPTPQAAIQYNRIGHNALRA
jgi:hypothetical protein